MVLSHGIEGKPGTTCLLVLGDVLGTVSKRLVAFWVWPLKPCRMR
jgi:hypothetical protein